MGSEEAESSEKRAGAAEALSVVQNGRLELKLTNRSGTCDTNVELGHERDQLH